MRISDFEPLPLEEIVGVCGVEGVAEAEAVVAVEAVEAFLITGWLISTGLLYSPHGPTGWLAIGSGLTAFALFLALDFCFPFLDDLFGEIGDFFCAMLAQFPDSQTRFALLNISRDNRVNVSCMSIC